MSHDHGHVPVMAREVLELLSLRPGADVADLTLGAGGHAELILEATAPGGRLFGFDRDLRALERARRRLVRFGERIHLAATSFDRAAEELAAAGAEELDGVVMDLGVSSMQLDEAERGFSFQQDGPLDMRMSGEGPTAADLLAKSGVAELERIFRDLGEEPRARAIARKVGELRKRTRITRTKELAELVRSVTGTRGRIHPATRVFQALRIAVNRELEQLETTLPAIIERLRPGGRLAVISFHSLEDRIVKQTFRRHEKEGRGESVTAKPVEPTAEERRANPRARSARLRCFERGEGGRP